METGRANRIHPTAVLGPQVELGAGNVIGPYVVLQGPVRLGDDNHLSPHVSIGAAADVRGHLLEPGWEEETGDTGVVIGSRNVFKEFTSVTTGWAEQTVLGDDCFLMGKAHVSHDCVVGDGVTLAHTVVLAGHVVVGDGANLGIGAVVHQRARVGAGAMVGMQSAVRDDLPPYAVSMGVPARPSRLNTYRLDKLDVPQEARGAIAALVLPPLTGSDGTARAAMLRQEALGALDGLPEAVRAPVLEWAQRRG